jgi:hypothetical protein
VETEAGPEVAVNNATCHVIWESSANSALVKAVLGCRGLTARNRAAAMNTVSTHIAADGVSMGPPCTIHSTMDVSTVSVEVTRAWSVAVLVRAPTLALALALALALTLLQTVSVRSKHRRRASCMNLVHCEINTVHFRR